MALGTTKKSPKSKKAAPAVKKAAAKKVTLEVGVEVNTPDSGKGVIAEIKVKPLLTKVVVSLSDGSRAVYFDHELS
tara:strand:- start:299 stop:526 length:228 start_codon:yes stop_codon:yes gene_type:complete